MKPRHSLLLWSYAGLLLLSSCLLFLVQPLVARMMLPGLGGTPVVWNTAQVFFQGALLGGYLWAHLLTRHLSLRGQVIAHSGLLIASCVTLPLVIPTPPPGAAPVGWLLGALTAGVGLPFFALSASAPLFQSWFSSTTHPQADDPYHLYSASNVGSIASLLVYPTLIETSLRLGQQAWLWSSLFVAFIVTVGLCAYLALAHARPPGDPEDAPGGAPAEAPPAPSWSNRLTWIGLAALPSALILSVTTHLTTDIAAIPLLWILPLTLFLATFVIVFARQERVPRLLRPDTLPQVVGVVLIVAFVFVDVQHILARLAMHLGGFLVICLVFHAELVRRRPHASHLTEFYLFMSLGGVLGGAFTALLAPLIFDRPLEYPLLVALAILFFPQWKEQSRAQTVALVIVPLLVLADATHVIVAQISTLEDPRLILSALFLSLAIIPCFWGARPWGVITMVAFMGIVLFITDSDRILERTRSYFGSYTVFEGTPGTVTLLHGNTNHGEQSRDPERRREPKSYYHPSGPLGLGFEQLQERHPDGLRVGAVGLGAGAIASYARPGDTFEFFEIDPEVARIARDTRFFTYLADCGDPCSVEIGDGRLLLVPERPAYDFLILDAYSSDSIPVHLLTRQAFALYASRITERGVLAFHVSNRYLNVQRVVAALARDAGFLVVDVMHLPTPEQEKRAVRASQWIYVTRDEAFVARVTQDERARRITRHDPDLVWSDDFSNLLDIIR
jgi:hypothetical protein